MSHFITPAFGLDEVQRVIASFSANSFYAFASQFIPISNTSSPDASGSDQESYFNDPYKNMVFAKQIQSTDVIKMVANYKWVANTIYDEWDNLTDLTGKKYFVIVDNDTEFYCFKCLSTPGTPSVNKPLLSDTSAADEFFITNDGYHWKYLFTIDKTTYNKFATVNFIPFVEDANVTANAIMGTIDKIKVGVPGSNYDTFYTNTFAVEDIVVGGNTLLFGIGSDSSPLTNFYKDSAITIIENTGVGQLRLITNSFSSGPNRLIVIDTPWATTPDVTSKYEITPGVLIYGTGSNAIARALVNTTASNSIYSIEILDRGKNYTTAFAEVTGNTQGQNTFAELLPILAPPGGHGSNPPGELKSTSMGFSITFANNESGTIPDYGVFRQWGIMGGTANSIGEPVYSKINIDYTNQHGQFVEGEEVVQLRKDLAGVVSVNTSSANITGSGTAFKSQYSDGDLAYVSNGTFSQLVSVTTVSSDTILETNASGGFSFACTSANVYEVESLNANGTVANVNLTTLDILTSHGVFVIDNTKILVGKSFGAEANLDTIRVNGATKQYATMDLRFRFNTDTGLGIDFPVGTQIDQGNSKVASATVHSFDATNGILYVANVSGNFTLGVNVAAGSNSCNLISIVEPDIKLFSADILYVENLRQLERSNTESETMKKVFIF